jgi:hypothetical protein
MKPDRELRIKEKTNVIKNKLNKLTLRRETLGTLEMQAATGGAAIGGTSVVVAHTVHSVCDLCPQFPVIPRQEWPQTAG